MEERGTTEQGVRGSAPASELPRLSMLEAASEGGTKGQNPGEIQLTLPLSIHSLTLWDIGYWAKQI